MEKIKKNSDVWYFFSYLILYSIAGFIIETTFGIFTKGVVESRKSFLYGPFCAIYGIGAIVMILFLKNERKIWKLFLFGGFIGAIVEYLMGFVFEEFFGVKWWDYSNLFLNIQGRTCLFYAISWGILAIFLIKYVNPNVDKFICMLKEKTIMFKCIVVLFISFFCFDALLSGYALKFFYYRVAIQNELDVKNKVLAQKEYEKIHQNSTFINFVNNYYNNEKMIKTYPNIMIEDKNNNTVYVDSLFEEYKVYYYRLGNFGDGDGPE